MDPTQNKDQNQPVINPVSVNPLGAERGPVVSEVPQAPSEVTPSYPEIHPPDDVASYVRPTIVVKPEQLQPTPKVILSDDPASLRLKIQTAQKQVSSDTSSGTTWKMFLEVFSWGKRLMGMQSQKAA